MLCKEVSSTILKSSIWRDLGLNPGLPDHWQTLYPLDQWAGIYIWHIVAKVLLALKCSSENIAISNSVFNLNIISMPCNYILVYIYKQDYALNNQQGLMCHKTQPTNYLSLYLIYTYDTFVTRQTNELSSGFMGSAAHSHPHRPGVIVLTAWSQGTFPRAIPACSCSVHRFGTRAATKMGNADEIEHFCDSRAWVSICA